MELWQKEKRHKAEKILQMLLEKTKDNGIVYTPQAQILENEFICTSIKELQDELVLRALLQLKKENNYSLHYFEELYSLYVKESFKKAQFNWTFYLPCYVNLKKRKISLLNIDLIIIPSRKLHGLHIKQVLQKSFYIKNQTIPDKFIVFTGQSLKKYNAYESNNVAFDLLRGLVDFTLLKNTWHIIFGKEERSRFPHPSWVLIVDDEGKSEIEKLSINGRKTRSMYALSQRQSKYLNKLIKLFEIKPPKNSTRELLVDCFRLYSQAMDALDNHQYFLNLWQIIENATVSEVKGGNTEEVIKRAGNLGATTLLKDIDIKASLKKIRDRRNKIVHRGMYFVSDIEVNILKLMAEKCIIWLLSRHKKLSTQDHIKEYLSLRSAPGKSIKTIKETLTFIEKVETRKRNNNSN